MDIVLYIGAPTEADLEKCNEAFITMSKRRAEKYAGRLHQRHGQRPFTSRKIAPLSLSKLLLYSSVEVLYTLRDALTWLAYGRSEDDKDNVLPGVEVQQPSRTSSNPTRPTPSKSGEDEDVNEELTRLRQEAEERLRLLTKSGRLPD